MIECLSDSGEMGYLVACSEQLEYAVTCDTCGEDEIYHAAEWQALMHQIREEGWTTRKVGTGWMHYCRECNRTGADLHGFKLR